MSSELKSVWVFNGEGAAFPSAVFSTFEKSDAWIASMELSGTLTEYPIDISVFDWVIREGFFKPKREFSADEIGRFSSAYQNHEHFTRGSTEGVEE